MKLDGSSSGKTKDEETLFFLREEDFRRAAGKIGCQIEAIKAVATVESNGLGFDSLGRPKILFERHWFHRLTNGQYDDDSSISSKKPGGYEGHDGDQWRRLAVASKLDREAALESASWGRFQIMGFNYKDCGYDSVLEFVSAMEEGVDKHLDAFVSFIINKGLSRYLVDRDWDAFARRYNGPNYHKNQYAERMDAAYSLYRTGRDIFTVRQIQSALIELGYNPGIIDGVVGSKTRKAIKHFQLDEDGLDVTGSIDRRLLRRLERRLAS